MKIKTKASVRTKPRIKPKAKTRTSIWISYDLGIRGDYEGLYAWLDDHGAKECVDSLALLAYEHQGPLRECIKADLSAAVKTDGRTRVYVIYRDRTSNKNKGLFVFGGRRAPTWAGYTSKETSDLIDEE